MHRHDWWR